MTLVELLVAGMLGLIVVFGVMTGMKKYGEFNAKSTVTSKSDQELAAINLILKSKLAGYHSLQNLSFRIPTNRNSNSTSSNPLQVVGSGFFVEKDTDFVGNASPCNDRLWAVVEVPTPRIELSGALGPGASQMILRTTGTPSPPPPDQFLGYGDLIAVTTINNSELIQITSSLISNTKVSLSTASFSHTFIPPGGNNTITQNYVDGDQVSKVMLLKIGYDSDSGSIRYDDGKSIQTVAKATGFSVFYNVMDNIVCNSGTGNKVLATTAFDPGMLDPSHKCGWTEPVNAPVPFARSQWNDLVGKDFGYSCYRRITKFEVQYGTSNSLGSGALAQSSVQVGRTDFLPNF